MVINKIKENIFIISVCIIFCEGILSIFLGGAAKIIVLVIPFLLITPLFFISNIYNKINISIYIYVFFVFYILIISIFSENIFASILGVILYTSYFIYGFLLTRFYCFDVYLESYNRMVVSIFYICTIFAFLQIITGYSFSSYQQDYIGYALGITIVPFRVSSSVGNSLPFGLAFTYISFYLYLTYEFTSKKKYLLFFIISFVVILTTLNRGALLMLLIAIMVSLIMLSIKEKKMRISLMFILCVQFLVVLYGAITQSPYFIRLLSSFSASDGGNSIRIGIWKSILDYISNYDSFIFGYQVGAAGNFLKSFGISPIFPVTESYYIKLLLETGVIGLFVFIVFLIASLFLSYKMIFSYEKGKVFVGVFTFSIILSHSAELITLQSLESIQVGFMFFITLGLMWSSYSSKRN